ncbi:RHS repeat-associated protein [Tahibacter aquaticus]|uniref:RHS repeat-associated protein n=1 Tax=Tahibacter aquaticus TaxID=520092 RepID=A0A4R6YFY2_9GAMM|nr:RHS repeat-associated core domain-containing protein [Tahibacter aquaticus]TDR35148.1 RHS repeat-associated protein [Tahibacter aquaticus]
MAESIKAEKIGTHFAAVVSPSLATTPFGKRAVPTLPAVDFSLALNTSPTSNGNSAPLFLLMSLATNATGDTLFLPTECLPDNPVDMSFATAHGHMGLILSLKAPLQSGAINCGVLSGPQASCSAEIEALVAALAEKMANEFQQAPLRFLQQFNDSANATVGRILETKATSAMDWLAGARDWAVEQTSYGIEYVLDGAAAQDIASAADYVASGQIVSDVRDGAAAAYEWSAEALETLQNLDYEQVYEACKQWLLETLGELTCDMRDALAALLADPRDMSVKMGEMYGTAKVAVAEAAAAVAVDVLVTKGAASAATRVGALVAKAGPRLGKLSDTIGDIIRRAKTKPDKGPDTHPRADKPAPHTPAGGKMPEADKTPEPKRDGDTVDGPPKPIPCLDCPVTVHPVNTVFGCKILNGEQELDFVIDAPLPLRWQRTYVSSNAQESCLGQGWSLPLDFRIDVEDAALVLIDTQGRRIVFPLVAVGAQSFSPYEQATLHRPGRNRCEYVTSDGLRLIFGLAPADYARLAALDQAEARQAEQFDHALAALRESGLIDLRAVSSTVAADHRPPQADRLRLLGLVDPNGNWLRVHYAADNLPHVVECSDGQHIGLYFDSGRSAAATPRLRRVSALMGVPDDHGRFAASRMLIEYRYSDEGDLVAVVDDSGTIVRSFAWSNHILVEHAEPGGIVSRYDWDTTTPRGRVVRNRVSTGEHLRFEYDPLARRNRVIDASGRVTTYCYDDSFYFTGLIAADGAHTRYQRDGHGNLIAVTDPLGRSTRYSYDGSGRLVRIAQPDQGVYLLRYAAAGRRPVAITDPLGQTTEYDYDSRGNMTETRDPIGAVTRYELDARGLPVRIHDARGGTVTLSYDRSGRLLEYRDCLGQPTRHSYDDRGNLSQTTDALGSITQYHYQCINRQHRVVAIVQADGAVERLAYDTLGRLIASIDANGNVTRYALAADGQPLVRENALGHTLRYQYDVHGRLIVLTNENGAVYRFAWDAADRLISERGFDGRRMDYRYNAAGELVEMADGVADGQAWLGAGQREIVRVRYQRDAAGRLIDKLSAKQTGSGQPEVRHSRYRYNLNGELVQARNAHARVDMHYTPAGRLAREVCVTRGGQATTLEHAYDGLGNRFQTVLPDGRVLRHRLYGSGHVDRITLDDQEVCSFERDAMHRETVRRQGSLQTFYERDALGRLLRQNTREADSASATAEPRIARQYRYDRSGQLLSVDDARNGASLYRYDATGRLLAAQGPAGEERFAFDPASNLLDTNASSIQAGPMPPRSWTELEWQAYVRENIAKPDFNPLFAPEQAAANPADWTQAKPNRLMVYQQHRYRYDRWGNCIEKRSGAHEVRRFCWDAEHRLERAQVTRVERGRLVTELWGYDYDPFGRRIAKYRLPEQVVANRSLQKIASSASQKLHPSDASRPCIASAATHFCWDGNRLLIEGSADQQSLHIYEPDSFVPLALFRSVVRSTGTAAGDADSDVVVARRERRRSKSARRANKSSVSYSRAAFSNRLKRDYSSLPLEWQALQEQYPEQWALVARRQEKLNRQMRAQLKTLVAADPVVGSTGEIFHVHTDHLGTPQEMTNREGEIVWVSSYKAWGAAADIEILPRPSLLETGHTVRTTEERKDLHFVQNLRFQGQFFDRETGLHYNRFRYYDPDIGKFSSQDPIGLLGGTNCYVYTPNPVNWVDPLGQSACRPQGIHEDNATKGVHLDVTAGGRKVELSAVPDHKGGVTFKPVFSHYPADVVERAKEEAEDWLAKPDNARKLLDNAERTLSFLQGLAKCTGAIAKLAQGKSAETSFLVKALRKKLP